MSTETSQIAALLSIYQKLLKSYFEITNENHAFARIIHQLRDLLDHLYTDLRSELPLASQSREALGVAQERNAKRHKHIASTLTYALQHLKHLDEQLEQRQRSLAHHREHIEEDIETLTQARTAENVVSTIAFLEKIPMRLTELDYLYHASQLQFDYTKELLANLSHQLAPQLAPPSSEPELDLSLFPSISRLNQLHTLAQEESRLCGQFSLAFREARETLIETLEKEFPEKISLWKKHQKQVKDNLEYLVASKLNITPHPSLTPFAGRARSGDVEA